jgi:hypothetical protein
MRRRIVGECTAAIAPNAQLKKAAQGDGGLFRQQQHKTRFACQTTHTFCQPRRLAIPNPPIASTPAGLHFPGCLHFFTVGHSIREFIAFPSPAAQFYRRTNNTLSSLPFPSPSQDG